MRFAAKNLWRRNFSHFGLSQVFLEEPLKNRFAFEFRFGGVEGWEFFNAFLDSQDMDRLLYHLDCDRGKKNSPFAWRLPGFLAACEIVAQLGGQGLTHVDLDNLGYDFGIGLLGSQERLGNFDDEKARSRQLVWQKMRHKSLELQKKAINEVARVLDSPLLSEALLTGCSAAKESKKTRYMLEWRQRIFDLQERLMRIE